MKTLIPAAIIALSAAAPATAEETAPIPDLARALLEAAADSGDVNEVEAVARATKAVFPDYTAGIDAATAAYVAALTPPEAPEEPQTPDAPAPKTAGGYFAIKPWDGKIQAGASYASGNSDNASFGLKLDAARIAGPWTHNFKAFADIAETNGDANQRRWGLAYKLDYNFGDRTYSYGRISYENDDFSGFDYRLFAGAGLGHYFHQSEAFTLKAEGGPGYRYSPIAMSDEVEKQFAAYGSVEIDWAIRDGVAFEQDFNVTWTEPTTSYQSITAVTTQLTDSISMGLSFEYRYETNPPAGRVNADEVARATLVYGF